MIESNIANLLKKLNNKTYHCGEYRKFIVYEPKERIIQSLPYVDRIVHQWYIEEFIKPYIVPRFIKDTYACIENRGVHKAVETLEKYMRKMKRENGSYYILKMDIKKYFYSIDKDILYNIMKRYIGDKYLLYLTYEFIYDTNDDCGIPIGNYTSQYYANIYLSELDHYIKEEIKCKYYVRYMDDFILLVKDKKDAKIMFELISKYLKRKLRLELNNKSRYYPSYKGINFCGYRIYETHRLLRNGCKKKIRRNINKWNKLYLENNLNKNKALLSFNSYLAHSKHCNSYNFNNRLKDKIFFEL